MILYNKFNKQLLIFISLVIFLMSLSFLYVYAISQSEVVSKRTDLTVITENVFNATSQSVLTGIIVADLNNDSFDDLIISAPSKNLSGGASDETGQVYIFYGRRNGFFNLSLNDANVTINGTSPGRFGNNIVINDVNYDSNLDLVISAQYKNLSGGAEDYTGQVYIFYNPSDKLFKSMTTDKANITFNGTIGSSFGGIGMPPSIESIIVDDFNNDNKKDILIPAQRSNLNGVADTNTGQVHIFYGSSDGFHSYSASEANVTINGTSASYFAFSLTSGDYNNDGNLDLAIGEPYKNLSGGAKDYTGQVYIFYGSSGGFHPYSAFESNVTFNCSTYKNTDCGYSIKTADLNNDNIDDLIVSAIGKNLSGGTSDYTGQVYILYGSSLLWQSADITEYANVTLNGSQKYSQFGFSTKPADLNNDDYMDLIVGANCKNTSGSPTSNYQGQVSVFFGTANGILPASDIEANISINGTDDDDGVGFWSIIGDFDGNNVNELVVSAPYVNLSGRYGITWEGQVYIFGINYKPTVSTIPNQAWNEDTSKTINLSLYFNDTNNDELNYTWDVGAHISVSINEATNIVTLTPTADWHGTSTIVFYANDSYNSLTASNNVTLTVVNVNDCGDNTCETGETCSSCQADCGFCTGSSSYAPLPKAKHIAAKLNANKNTEFNLGEKTIVKKVNLKVNKDLENVIIEAKEKTTVTNEYDKKVYKYIEISTSGITTDDINEAEIEFDVEKEWLKNSSIKPSEIILLRYKDSWQELETSLASEDSNKYYFKAKTPGFSDFAISFKEEQKEEPIKQETKNITKETVKETKKEDLKQAVEETKSVIEEKSNTLWYALGALALLIIIALVVFLKFRIRK